MKSYPFTSEVTYDPQGLPLYDRAVDSEFLRAVFAQYFSDGVFYNPSSSLQVVADAGMQVKVQPGACHIRGAMGIEEEPRTLAVQAAESQDRIDTVVARFDLSRDARKIDLYVVKGTAAESPQPPELTRDATIWELGLANLFIAKATADIPTQRITDTRLDTGRCGMVMVPLDTPDWEPYFAQLQAVIAAQAEAGTEQMADWQAAFNTWFEHIKGQLSEDAAGNLQLQVDAAMAAAQAATSQEHLVTLQAGSWAEAADGDHTVYTQTIEIAGFTEDTKIVPTRASTPTGTLEEQLAVAEELGFLSKYETVAGGLKVTCVDDVPTLDLPLVITEVR